MRHSNSPDDSTKPSDEASSSEAHSPEAGSVGESCTSICELVAVLGTGINDPARSLDMLVEQLDRLRCQLRHQLVRDDDGIIEEAVFQAPWLTACAETLRHDHVELMRALETLRERLTPSSGSKVDIEAIKGAYDLFTVLLSKHDDGRRNLLYESQLCQGHLHD